jgi:hypothetical protein
MMEINDGDVISVLYDGKLINGIVQLNGVMSITLVDTIIAEPGDMISRRVKSENGWSEVKRNYFGITFKMRE